ncbi:MAG: transposase, partial [Nitrososphaeraceae archaeon]
MSVKSNQKRKKYKRKLNWRRRHHDKYSSRKGFIKVHVAVDTRSKLILSMKVTKEDAGDE